MSQLLCGYRNGSPDLVLMRCFGPDTRRLERVIFPFELITFCCAAASEVQIWRRCRVTQPGQATCQDTAGEELVEALPAEELQLEHPDPGLGMDQRSGRAARAAVP